MDKLLSIIIPTRNRQTYCIQSIEQIVNLKLPNAEIIIQDNSDDTMLLNMLKEKNIIDNVNYHYCSNVLSFVENFDQALSHAKGEYLFMIGDDDGILPNIIDVVKFAKKNEYDAVIPGLNAVYIWPSETPIVKNGENGYLCLSHIKNKRKKVDTDKGIYNLMKNAGQQYQNFDIPRIYHGLVSRTIIEKIREINGVVFDGLSPDIYASIALSFVCKKVVRIMYPVSISGICSNSGSAASANGKHIGKLEDAPHFIGHKNYEWDTKIPKIYSVESIWAETVMHSLKDFQKYEFYEKFNVSRLDAICYGKYPQLHKEINEHIHAQKMSKTKIIILGILLKWQFLCKKIIKRVFRKKESVKKYYNVTSICFAYEITEKCVKEIVYDINSKN